MDQINLTCSRFRQLHWIPLKWLNMERKAPNIFTSIALDKQITWFDEPSGMITSFPCFGRRLCRCTFILDINGEAQPFDQTHQEEVVRSVIEPMASDGLRTIAIAYKTYVKPGKSDLVGQPFHPRFQRGTGDNPSLCTPPSLVAFTGCGEGLSTRISVLFAARRWPLGLLSMWELINSISGLSRYRRHRSRLTILSLTVLYPF